MESTKTFYDCGAAGILSSATFDNVLIGMIKSKETVLFYDKLRPKMNELERRWFKDEDKILQALRTHLGEAGVVCKDAVFPRKLVDRIMDIVPLPSGNFDLNIVGGCKICVLPEVVDALKPLLPMNQQPASPPDSHPWLIYYKLENVTKVQRHYPTWQNTVLLNVDVVSSFVYSELGSSAHYRHRLGEQLFFWSKAFLKKVSGFHREGSTVVLRLRDHASIRVNLDDATLYPKMVRQLLKHVKGLWPIHPDSFPFPHLEAPDGIRAVFFNSEKETISYVVSWELFNFRCTPEEAEQQLKALEHVGSTLGYNRHKLILRSLEDVTVVPDGLQVRGVMLILQPEAEMFNQLFFGHRLPQ